MWLNGERDWMKLRSKHLWGGDFYRGWNPGGWKRREGCERVVRGVRRGRDGEARNNRMTGAIPLMDLPSFFFVYKDVYSRDGGPGIKLEYQSKI